jgi:hypothetical protein
VTFISGLPRGFGTCCLRFTNGVATVMQDSLPAGWLAFAGRELNPLDYYERFPSCYISFPFPGFILTLYGWKAGVSGGTFPALDITTTATGLLCWRDSHPLGWHLASLHGQTRPNWAVRVMSGLPRSRRLGRTSRLGSFVPIADITRTRERAGQAQAGWPSFKLEQDRETRARL